MEWYLLPFAGAIVGVALRLLWERNSYNYYSEISKVDDVKLKVKLYKMAKSFVRGRYTVERVAEDVIEYVVIPDTETEHLYHVVSGVLLAGKPFRKLKLAGKLFIYNVFFTTVVNGKEYVNVNWHEGK